METVVVHEWLTNMAGSEKVVAAIRDSFDGPRLRTSVAWWPAFPGWTDVETTRLQRFVKGPASHVRLLPLLPAAWASLPPTQADLVVTSFHTFALYNRVAAGVPHLVYCHTPPRFIWSRQQLAGERLPGRSLAMRLASLALRPADVRRATRGATFVANSRAVAARIASAYGIPSEVVHPPVSVERFAREVGRPKDDYFLVVSRLVPYKRVDLAVEAFAELGLPLKVAGSGRGLEALRASAPANVEFLGHVSDEELVVLMARARALLMPGEEDFGITPVEAMAAGTPVIAFAAGGALETVTEGRSGAFFREPTTAALATAVREVARIEWDAGDISASVAHFGEERFGREIRDVAASIEASATTRAGRSRLGRRRTLTESAGQKSPSPTWARRATAPAP